MDEQDKKILELYLKDVRKKKIFFVFIVIFIITNILFFSIYVKYKQSSNNTENFIQEETEVNVINENNISEENTSNVESTVDEENQNEPKEEKNEEINIVSKEENIIQETQQASKIITTQSNENNERTKDRPSNRDFLFSDGYTMENVTQAAQEYLTSSGYSGECIPIKDSDGVYLGMRVTFYWNFKKSADKSKKTRYYLIKGGSLVWRRK